MDGQPPHPPAPWPAGRSGGGRRPPRRRRGRRHVRRRERSRPTDPSTEYVVAATRPRRPAASSPRPTSRRRRSTSRPRRPPLLHRDPSSLVGTITLGPVLEGELLQASAIGEPVADGVPTWRVVARRGRPRRRPPRRRPRRRPTRPTAATDASTHLVVSTRRASSPCPPARDDVVAEAGEVQRAPRGGRPRRGASSSSTRSTPARSRLVAVTGADRRWPRRRHLPADARRPTPHRGRRLMAGDRYVAPRAGARALRLVHRGRPVGDGRLDPARVREVHRRRGAAAGSASAGRSPRCWSTPPPARSTATCSTSRAPTASPWSSSTTGAPAATGGRSAPPPCCTRASIGEELLDALGRSRPHDRRRRPRSPTGEPDDRAAAARGWARSSPSPGRAAPARRPWRWRSAQGLADDDGHHGQVLARRPAASTPTRPCSTTPATSCPGVQELVDAHRSGRPGPTGDPAPHLRRRQPAATACCSACGATGTGRRCGPAASRPRSPGCSAPSGSSSPTSTPTSRARPSAARSRSRSATCWPARVGGPRRRGRGRSALPGSRASTAWSAWSTPARAHGVDPRAHPRRGQPRRPAPAKGRAELSPRASPTSPRPRRRSRRSSDRVHVARPAWPRRPAPRRRPPAAVAHRPACRRRASRPRPDAGGRADAGPVTRCRVAPGSLGAWSEEEPDEPVSVPRDAEVSPLVEIERAVLDRAKGVALDMGETRRRRAAPRADRGRGGPLVGRPQAGAARRSTWPTPRSSSSGRTATSAATARSTPLLDDDDVWEIMINAPDEIFVKRHSGHSGYHDEVFHDDDHVDPDPHQGPRRRVDARTASSTRPRGCRTPSSTTAPGCTSCTATSPAAAT